MPGWTGERVHDVQGRLAGPGPRVWQNRRMSPAARAQRIRAATRLAAALAVVFALASCAVGNQVRHEVATSNLGLAADDLERHGVGFLTPAAATGREADKQTLAQAFARELAAARPGVGIVSLPAVLSEVNAADLDQQYKRMYRDYLETGILEGSVLKQVGEISGARYLAQLSLADFQQQSRGRFSFLGLRMVDTKQANMRVFVQLWDSTTGGVVWEGSGELNYAYESAAENPAPFLEAASLAARRLYQELPGAPPAK